MPLAVVFTGSRYFDPSHPSAQHIRVLLDRFPKDTIVIHGGADGVDNFVDVEARKRSLNVHKVPADWSNLGRKAGPIRNSLMLALLASYRDYGYHTRVCAFPRTDSTGTRDCMTKAGKMGFVVKGKRLY